MPRFNDLKRFGRPPTEARASASKSRQTTMPVTLPSPPFSRFCLERSSPYLRKKTQRLSRACFRLREAPPGSFPWERNLTTRFPPGKDQAPEPLCRYLSTTRCKDCGHFRRCWWVSPVEVLSHPHLAAARFLGSRPQKCRQRLAPPMMGCCFRNQLSPDRALVRGV